MPPPMPGPPRGWISHVEPASSAADPADEGDPVADLPGSPVALPLAPSPLLRNGLSSGAVVAADDEDADAFERCVAMLRVDLGAERPLAALLAERVAASFWRQARFDRAERRLFNVLLLRRDDDSAGIDSAQLRLDMITRARGDACRDLARTLRLLGCRDVGDLPESRPVQAPDAEAHAASAAVEPVVQPHEVPIAAWANLPEASPIDLAEPADDDEADDPTPPDPPPARPLDLATVKQVLSLIRHEMPEAVERWPALYERDGTSPRIGSAFPGSLHRRAPEDARNGAILAIRLIRKVLIERSPQLASRWPGVFGDDPAAAVVATSAAREEPPSSPSARSGGNPDPIAGATAPATAGAGASADAVPAASTIGLGTAPSADRSSSAAGAALDAVSRNEPEPAVATVSRATGASSHEATPTTAPGASRRPDPADPAIRPAPTGSNPIMPSSTAPSAECRRGTRNRPEPPAPSPDPSRRPPERPGTAFVSPPESKDIRDPRTRPEDRPFRTPAWYLRRTYEAVESAVRPPSPRKGY